MDFHLSVNDVTDEKLAAILNGLANGLSSVNTAPSSKAVKENLSRSIVVGPQPTKEEITKAVETVVTPVPEPKQEETIPEPEEKEPVKTGKKKKAVADVKEPPKDKDGFTVTHDTVKAKAQKIIQKDKKQRAEVIKLVQGLGADIITNLPEDKLVEFDSLLDKLDDDLPF